MQKFLVKFLNEDNDLGPQTLNCQAGFPKILSTLLSALKVNIDFVFLSLNFSYMCKMCLYLKLPIARILYK